jgi:hypothetical protein
MIGYRMVGHKLTCRCAAGCAARAAAKEEQCLLQLAGAAKCMSRVTRANLTSIANRAAGSAGAAVLVLCEPRLQVQHSVSRVVKLLDVALAVPLKDACARGKSRSTAEACQDHGRLPLWHAAR